MDLKLWRRQVNEIFFSLRITSIFLILNVDLWCPGDSVNCEGKNYLLNAMFDITQFVVTVLISGCTSATIAHQFMHDVLMNFGLYHLVVIDDGTPFNIVFTTMCDCLIINYAVVSKHNYKGVSVKRSHRFLNKVVIIASNNRDMVIIFFRSRDYRHLYMEQR